MCQSAAPCGQRQIAPAAGPEANLAYPGAGGRSPPAPAEVKAGLANS